MILDQKKKLEDLFLRATESLGVHNPKIILERPKDSSHGDFASNAAMQLARELKKSPREIATSLIQTLSSYPETKNLVEKFDIAGPGFINIYLAHNAINKIVQDILIQGAKYGVAEKTKGKILLEYVSANPTGPLHLGHARQGALGDVLSNILACRGFDVSREFYYNDAGVQIDTLTTSVELRIKELLGEKIVFPEDGYKGDYIVDIAKDFLAKKSITSRDGEIVQASGNIEDKKNIREFSITYLQKEQDNDLKMLGVSFDNFYLESSLYTDGLVEKAVKACQDANQTYEKDGALWLKTTEFEAIPDDKDRVMRKADGHYTYFVPDIAYHLSKFTRGFHKAINIQGSDHHGTTARVRIGVQIASKQLGLSIPCPYPDYVLHKMLKVVRDGQEVKMSKRAGTYVTLHDLVNWVGKDAARYFLVSRKPDSEFVFDVNLALSKNDENPVYYLQYAHARIASVFRLAQEKNFKLPSEKEAAQSSLDLLKEKSELNLIQRLGEYIEILDIAAKDFAPHLLCNYLKSLAADFHTFYNDQRILVEDEALRLSRMALLLATQRILQNGFNLLGIEAPERM